ncbi:hypothetical protein KLP40_18305 [Hymenobacter sp. NST-14]|uniref:hypothetical protein n=1 Tax=Hymenobacter piscis TaxID=2839984 RepID=UPI001C01E014|nr:hypothetical protein [Hymenobacter piscis]MBT9395126.1 hypothetical protein [Hymenobacter piscis]
MAEHALFVPECWADTALMHALLVTPNNHNLISHAQGIGNVGRVLKDEKGLRQGRRLVGMVDRDKKFAENPYLAEFTQIVAGSLDRTSPHCILRHATRPDQHLIVLNPACDTWLFQAAQEASVSLIDLDIATTLPEFIDFCKQDGITNNPRMKELLWAIQQARPAIYRELADFIASIMDITPKKAH